MNAAIRFRVDNLRITELPLLELHFEAYGADQLLLWWDSAYGFAQNGTLLQESSPGVANWSNTTDGVEFSDATRAGRILSKTGASRLFRLKASGTPPL